MRQQALKIWSPAHAALLEALRAQALIPRLYERLALERDGASEEELRRLMAWPAELMRQPGWALIEPSLDDPNAWPETWQLAREMGFTPLCEHHHALLFGRLTERLVEAEHYDQARWTWSEALKSWRALAKTPYLPELLDVVLPEPDMTTADEAQRDNPAPLHQELLTTLLDDLIARRVSGLRRAWRLDESDRERRSRLDHRLARFEWYALDEASAVLGADAAGSSQARARDASSMLRHAGALAYDARRALRAELREVFARDTAQIDVTQDSSEQLLSSFSFLAECSELIGHDLDTSTQVVLAAVELAWKLRHTGREEQGDDLSRLLLLAAPFHAELMRHIEREGYVGPNSKCSDFLVFQGEDSPDHATRRAAFERALTICPGHRNASLMLSYEHLHLAAQALNALGLIPAPLKHLPVGERPKMLWRSAKQHIDEAEAIYPFNERLERYRATLSEVAERLRIPIL